MAGSKVKGINIKIGADTTGLDEALNSIEGKSKSARSELIEVNRALKSNKDSVVLWEQKHELLSKAFENSKEKLNMLESAQRDVNKQLENKTITGEQYRAFQREVENARAETKRFGGQLEEAENKVKELKGTADKTAESAHDLGDDLHDAGEQAEKSSGGYTVLKGTLANLAAEGFKNLVSSAKEAREEINQGYETIITKTGASGKSLEEFKDIANDVFTTMPVDMDDVGTAVGEINTRFDETGKTLEDMTEIFLKYARINSSDVNSSIDNVSSAMKAFNVDTSEVADVLDVLSAVGQKTGINIGSLESNLVSNSATFKEMGLSIYEAAQLLGQFEKNGVDTSTAITGLKKAQQEATSEGKTMTEALGENITAIKNAGTETEALQIATELFGKRGASAMTQAIREGRFELSDLEGNMSVFSGTVSKTFNAVQKEPDKLKISTNKLKIELASLAEKVMPKVESMIDVFNKNLPKMISYGKTLIPVAKGVGAAFAAWKISQKANEGVDSIKKLFDSMKKGDSIMKTFNATLKANPLGTVATAVGTVTTAIGAATTAVDFFREKAKQKAEDKKKSLAALIKDEYKEAAERINDTSDSLKNMKDSFNEKAGNIEAETGRTKDLWNQLQELADASGKVKDADKIRADYILGELNDALGTEYTMTGNQIDNYKTMQTEIDKLIEKKRAMAYIEAYGADAVEYEKLRTQSLEDYAANKTAFDKYDRQMEEIRIKASQLTGRYIADENELGDLLNHLDLTGNNLQNDGVDLNALKKLIDPYNNLIENYKTTRDNMNEALANYNEATAYFNTNDKAMKLASEGNYDEVAKVLYANDNANVTAYKNASESDAKRAEAFKTALTEQLNALDLALKSGRSDAVNATIATLSDIVKDGKQYGFELGDEFTSGMKSKVKEMADDGFDLSGIVEMGQECGIDTGKIWSGEFKDLVQAQINKGYDIRKMLAWGETSGGLTANDYSGEFGKEVQNYISSMYPDTTGLMQWAIEQGISLGELFGESFRSYADAYMEEQFWENWDTNGVQSITSAADSARYYAGTYGIGSKSNLRYWNPETGEDYYAKDHPDWVEKFAGIKAYAAGGFLGSGQGIVAEAGPELIEIMNGGAKITPLTGTARNTPVTSGNSGRVVYINNTINAQISGKYDVRHLAEDLAGEQRRIERNLGL